MPSFFQGLKRKDAEEKRNGEKKVTEGKESMSVELYKWLAKSFLEKNNFFGWSYLVLCWNLMCRTNNIAHLRFAHVTWSGDNMGFVLPMSKTDQGTSSAVCNSSILNLSRGRQQGPHPRLCESVSARDMSDCRLGRLPDVH